MPIHHHPTSTTPTLYLSAQDVVHIVRRKGLRACFMGIAERIHRGFLRWAHFDKSSRLACHSMRGAIELMPIADAQTYAFKYVNGHPGNSQWGLPTVMAFGVLADVDTGLPRLLSEFTLGTALRTAAMSALAAKVLARPGCTRMALIGNGAQGEFQALAFMHLLDIDEVRLFDTDRHASEKLMRNLHDSGLKLQMCHSVAEAAQGADIITTATADKRQAVIISADMVQPGMHINAIGGDCPGKTELHPEVLRRASVFVEYEPQTRVEGEIQQLPEHFEVTELWQVFSGQKPGRTANSQVTVFDSVGFALEDHATLCFLHDTALELDLGRPMDWMQNLSNPKDLFSALQQSTPAVVGPHL